MGLPRSDTELEVRVRTYMERERERERERKRERERVQRRWTRERSRRTVCVHGGVTGQTRMV